MYIAPSKLSGAGLGVFAGRALHKDQLVESEIGILVPKSFVAHWSLMNYVYGMVL
jgi:hypothetical protein